MVGGNLNVIIQTKTTYNNDLGESINQWVDSYQLMGWLDLTSGSSTRSHKTKTEESSHVFLCDYNEVIRNLDITKCRLLYKTRIYEITYIDDPMEINDHLEIFLKLVGVNNV